MHILSESAAEAFEKRGISAETAARFQIYTGSAVYLEDEEGNRSLDRVDPDPAGNIIVFPFLEHGVVINEKYRNPQKKFMQKKGGRRTFWNSDVLDDPALQDGRQALIITEGEIDGLTAIDCGFPLTVSVPDGAYLPPKEVRKSDDPIDDSAGKFEFLWNNRERLKKVKRFIIAMDGDAAGQHMAAELVRRLSASRCQFLTYPEGCKDLNDVRMKFDAAMVAKILNEAQHYPVRGLFQLHQYPDAPGIQALSTGWETLDVHFKLFTPSLVIVSGVPSHGKSTWVNHLLINAARLHGWRTAIFSPEMPVIPHLRDKMRRCASKMTMDELAKSDRLGNIDRWIEDRFVFIDHDFEDGEEDITLDWVLDRMADAVLRFGVNCGVIDPWNEIEHARRRDETMSEYISRALRQIKKFAKKYNLCIFVVAHPTKEVGKDGKSRTPTLYDIEHSAAWYNKADVGIIVDRPDFDSDETAIHVQKVKFEGTGVKGKIMMAFDVERSRYMLLDSQERARRVKLSDYQ
jgi:twinkle protein